MVNKQKKNFAKYFKNKVLGQKEFYIKISLIFLLIFIFLAIFIVQDGILFFEYYPYVQKFENYDFQVHFIGVGNGDAILIKFPNDKTMMIDTGDDYYENKVTSYVQQFLWSENLKQIDYLVLTHPDSDHVGGACAILDRFKVENIYRPKIYSKTEYDNLENKENYKVTSTEIYDRVITKAYKKKCNMIFTEANIDFADVGADVEFLSPLYDNYQASNNYSAVIKITYNSKSFLFVGDAETSVEEDLIKIYKEKLKADVLKNRPPWFKYIFVCPIFESG